LPCVMIVERGAGVVGPAVDVDEPLAGVVRPDGVVCVPVTG
jgi:hypothetical protein